MSTIELYTTGLHLEKNYIIDNITKFLASDNVTRVYLYTNFQYIRPEYDISVKIDAEQSLLNRTKNPDYLVLTQDNRIWYYYVNKVEQVAQKTLRFRCTMDVLNTFNGKYHLTNNSLIERQHVDRWRPISKGGSESVATATAVFIPSRTDEGLNVAKYVKSSSVIMPSAAAGDLNDIFWYMVYRTDSDTGAPVVDIVPAEKLLVYNGSTQNTHTMKAADYSAGIYYAVVGDSWSVHGTGGTATWNAAGGTLLFRSESGTSGRFWEINYVDTNGITVNIESDALRGKYIDTLVITNGEYLYSGTSGSNNIDIIQNLPKTFIGAAARYLLSVEDIDKTDKTITKIVECPYCPILIKSKTPGEGEYNYTWPADFYFKDGFLRTQNLQHDYTIEGFSVKLSANQSKNISIAKTTLQSAQILDDPKANNTEISPKILYYDNFSLTLPYENLIPGDAPSILPILAKIVYTQTGSISSDLLFNVALPDGIGWNWEKENPYEGALLSNRNNEVPLFTDDYQNYLKNGYNFDKKRMEVRDTQQAISLGVGAVRGAVSGGASGAGAALLSAAVGGYQAMLSNASQELTIAEKINALKNKGFSVSTVDNLALFKKYAENRLIAVTYGPDAAVLEMINKYFQLYGYAQGFFAAPETATRYAFNYVRADVDIDGDLFQPYFDAKDAIKNKYAGGVYYIHNRAATPNFWDLDLSSANWEISLLPDSWI